MPLIPADIMVVPVPTIRPHIRQRGFGHSELVAREFAKRRNLPFRTGLERLGTYVQQGASLSDRITQAKKSFRARGDFADMRVLLVDDVFTTGSTVQYAANVLREAGADEVWIAITARQTLDDKG